jgi:oxygen-independent coproporphyrinogen-3 oxidase
MEEFMFLGLRLTEGISTEEFRSEFGVDIFEVYGDAINSLICEELLAANHTRLALTGRGVDVSNRVFMRFLF